MKGHVQTFVLTRNAWTEGIDPVSVTSSFFVIPDITCKQDFAHCFKTQKEFYAPIHCSGRAKRKKSIEFYTFKTFISGAWEKKIISKENRVENYSPRYLKPYKQDHKSDDFWQNIRRL